jgi:hypothetical protein
MMLKMGLSTMSKRFSQDAGGPSDQLFSATMPPPIRPADETCARRSR